MVVEKADAYLPERLLAAAPVLPLRVSRSDYDLNPHMQRPRAPDLAPAAVLLPIVKRTNPTVLFTRRTPHLARHAGQVSFPGGRWHPLDDSLLATALRETEEETGIEQKFISVAGFLEAYETGTGFAILPVVALLDSGFSLRPNMEEVAEIFEVPLAFLLDRRNCARHTGEWKGVSRQFYAFTWREHYIWGATAAIVVSLCERLRP